VIFMALSPPRARSLTIEDTRQDILWGVCSPNIKRSVQAYGSEEVNPPEELPNHERNASPLHNKTMQSQ
jgi:hypothetical protein